LVAYAGRWPGSTDQPKYQLPKGFKKSLELFNLHRAILEPPDQPLVIVEGYFDVMKLHQHGCKKVVALMGSSMSEAQEALLQKHTDAVSRIILMLDEDDAGRNARNDIALRLAQFVFVRIYAFDKPESQPEHLAPEQVQKLLTSA
jgi:DNA primase